MRRLLLRWEMFPLPIASAVGVIHHSSRVGFTAWSGLHPFANRGHYITADFVSGCCISRNILANSTLHQSSDPPQPRQRPIAASPTFTGASVRLSILQPARIQQTCRPEPQPRLTLLLSGRQPILEMMERGMRSVIDAPPLAGLS
jgi:hypothetical protein